MLMWQASQRRLNKRIGLRPRPMQAGITSGHHTTANGLGVTRSPCCHLNAGVGGRRSFPADSAGGNERRLSPDDPCPPSEGFFCSTPRKWYTAVNPSTQVPAMPAGWPGNSVTKLARAAAGGGFESDIRATANKFFELEFSGGTPLYQGSGNAHPGGGFIQFLSNDVNGVGSGINGTNIDSVNITDDPLFPSVTGLRNTYQAGGTAYSFSNQTLFAQHPETQRTYRRMRIRWSDNWQWGSDQLKFCKNIGVGGLSTNCPKFKDNFMHITKLDPDGTNNQQVYATDARADAQGNPAYFIADDINNGFGPNNTDADFTPVNGQWYWLEWEIDAGSPGGSDGWYKIWIDGKLYMYLSNTPVRESSDGGFANFELGHVWQNGSPTEDIWMDWHSLSVWDRRPDNLPEGIA